MKFFNDYFNYTGDSEVPMIFHRWTAVSIIGALLARKVYCPFGHSQIYANQYVLLTGSPGSRKGSAIKVGTGLLKELEFGYFAPNRAAKEALWEWMAKQEAAIEIDDWIEDVILDGDSTVNSDFISQAYIATDEFLDFIGMGDEGLMTNLTNLWDNLSVYSHPKTRSKDIVVPNPTMNILSGITPGGIAEAFKGLASSGGFFSRILFIFSNPSSTKITFPSAPDFNIKKTLLNHLTEIQSLEGPLDIPRNGEVYKFLDGVYKSTPPMGDSRFAYYAQRRFTHLIKLVTVMAAADLTLKPTIEHCLLANTILAAAEHQMPNAIGEYGKSKHAEVSNKIVEMINHSNIPLTPQIIWKAISRDLEKMSLLQEILQNLIVAERIQKTSLRGAIAYISNFKNTASWKSNFIDYSLLHDDEHLEDTPQLAEKLKC